MADYSGRQSYIGLGKETTRGTAVAASYWLRWLSRDFQDQVEKVRNESALGVLNKYSGSDIVKEWAAGKIGGKLTDRAFGLVLVGLFGSDPVTALKGGESVVYNHTFNFANTVLGRSLTTYIKDGNKDVRHSLSMFDKGELSCLVGEYVKFETEVMAKKSATTTSTPAIVAENEFVPRHVTVKLASNVAGLPGATAVKLKAFKFTIDRKVEGWFGLGSNEPDEIHAQEISIKGEFTLRYTDETYRNLWKADTKQAIELLIANTDTTIGTSSNPAVKFTFHEVTLDDWSDDNDKSKIVEQTIGFSGNYNLSAAKELEAVLTNLVTTY